MFAFFDRVVHSERSFHAAREECSELGGKLLSLGNVKQVFSNLGSHYIGNVDGPFRIDGWFEGEWLEQENATISSSHEAVTAMTQATLTVNLEDGSVSGSHHAKDRLGYICEGDGMSGKGCKANEDMKNSQGSRAGAANPGSAHVEKTTTGAPQPLAVNNDGSPGNSGR